MNWLEATSPQDALRADAIDALLRLGAVIVAVETNWTLGTGTVEIALPYHAAMHALDRMERARRIRARCD